MREPAHDPGEWSSLEVPPGWEWTDFDGLFENVTSSERKLAATSYEAQGALPVVDQGRGAIGGYTNRHELAHPVSGPLIVFGDHTRCVKLVNHPFVQGADGVKVLRVRSGIDPNFAYRALETIKLPDKGYSRHYKFLSASRFPVAPLNEQKRIVAKLDALQARSEAAKEALDAIPPLLEKFRQSVLASAFRGDLTRKWRRSNPSNSDWQVVDLQAICTSIADGDHQAPPKSESGIPFITISAMNTGTVYLERATRCVPLGYYNSLKAERRPQPGDVLYSVTGSIGIAALVESDNPFVFQRHIAILRPDPAKTRSRFLYHRLSGEDIKEQAREVATGTAQVTIPLGGLRRFRLTVPSLEEQDEVVRCLDSQFAAIANVWASVGRIADDRTRLSQSILAKAFRGELFPQDPTDEPASTLLESIRAERAAASAAPKPKRGRKVLG